MIAECRAKVHILLLLAVVAEAALRGQSSSQVRQAELPLAADSQGWHSNLHNAGRHMASFLHSRFESFASQLRSRSPRHRAAKQESQRPSFDAALGPMRPDLNRTSVQLDGLSLLQEEVDMTVAPPESLNVVGSPDMMISDAEVTREDVRVSSYPPPWMGVLSVALLGGLAAKLVFTRQSDECRSSLDAKKCSDEPELGRKSPDHQAQVAETPPVTGGSEQALLNVVRQLPVHSGDDILPARKSYDCLFAHPQEDLACCRLVGRVKATGATTLQSPVSGEDCVLYSTSAAEHRLDGVHALPAAFDAVTLDFALELSGSEGQTEVHVSGHDVALFAQEVGCHQRRAAFRDASERLQSFVRTHRVACAGSSQFSAADGSRVLDFSESCLPVGSLVCCVGKLHRSMTGRLELLPCDVSALSATSELLQQGERVLISDNASLLGA
mmetsp:Transcript_13285/g.30242  ORF Transcript_13285/g.30242 Transcript_13285/m.30242 type:complete len:441 (-) Transcript_13285:204-1526(-)